MDQTGLKGAEPESSEPWGEFIFQPGAPPSPPVQLQTFSATPLPSAVVAPAARRAFPVQVVALAALGVVLVAATGLVVRAALRSEPATVVTANVQNNDARIEAIRRGLKEQRAAAANAAVVPPRARPSRAAAAAKVAPAPAKPAPMAAAKPRSQARPAKFADEPADPDDELKRPSLD